MAAQLPALPTPAEQGASGPNLGPLAVVVRRAGRTHDDDPFADLADPASDVRAWAMAGAGARAEVRDALRAAAAEDEDTEVRWAARYALRMAAATIPPSED